MPISRDEDEGLLKGSRGKGVQKQSLFRKAWRGTKWFASVPFQAFPHEDIVKTGRMIAGLSDDLRRVRKGDRRFRVNKDWSFDLVATAFLHGVSVAAIEELLVRRRRVTARAAYLAFGFGWLFFLGWLWRAATMQWTLGTAASMLEFAPFCVCFFVAAFWNALQNYQIRTRRLATAWEYLATTGAFWPS
ncbi:hypothetical protein RZS28_18890 (plasmid) [Methylocapsa polymorpha]|uniref:Uncharacterized protein n=1 Tax=Methylocapsa polymorpha TaxID=3080828 RepID=A0ABZ0HWZ5_9HYPH|nr:hypothetical protein [Methylocapsa sp. RX1]WOJ91797.1 hypothetical protein RZS28_18890 [Methylocapsa sp. RX1]